jgi:hypothetical protein
MANVTKPLSAWEGGFINWTYDDATFRLQSFTYQNLVNRPFQITLTSPQGVDTVIAIPAQQPLTTTSVLAFNITLRDVVGKGGVHGVAPPAGWTYSF